MVSHHLFDDGTEELARIGVPAPIVLRDYQERAKSAVLAARDRGLHRVMVVMPTGTGKTTLFASLVDQFHRDYDSASLVVAHRQELLQQAAARLSLMSPNINVGIEGGDLKAPFESRAVVAGVQSIGRPDTKRLEWFKPGFLIIDEGHHAPADTWQNVMRRFGSYSGECFTLAVTATDHRMDNRPLHGHEEAIFEDVVFRYSLRQAVSDGWLVDLRGYRVATGVDISNVRTQLGDYNQSQLARAVNTEERNQTAFQHWAEIARDRRTIVFCVDVQHAKDVTSLFRDWRIDAEYVDGSMKTEHREAVMRRFRDGRTQVLVNVEVATEGFDVPAADCVLMLRPTQSWALYTQMAGRGVRPLPGIVDGVGDPILRRAAIRESEKPDCYVIDVVDVSKQFSLQTPPEEDGETKAKVQATAAGLVGLPPDFDLEGHSLFEAAEWAEELPPVKRAEMFRRPMTFGELSTVLSEVDLLHELSIPEEVMGVSRLAWLKTGVAEYFLPCGNSGIDIDRSAVIRCDELGRYTLHLRSKLMDYGSVPLGTDLAESFDRADRSIHQIWPDCGQIVKANARWRDEAPTDRQITILRRFGIEDETIAMVKTKGQARALIEQCKLGAPRKKRTAR